MKRNFIIALSALLMICACGKKSKEDTAPVASTPQLSSEEVITEATQRIIDAVNSNNNAKLEDLIKNGAKANLDVIVPTGDTLLCQALKNGYTDIANTLIAAGADINKKNNQGLTPLMVIAMKGNLDYLKNDFLKYRETIKFNLQDNNGNTALNHAILNEHELVANLLIDENADVRITNTQAKNSEDLSKEKGMMALYARILKIIDSQRGRADRATILKYIKEGKTKDLEGAIEFDPAIVIDYADMSLIYTAIMENQDTGIAGSMVNFLLEKQANPNGYTGSKRIPLIAAVKKQSINIINSLIGAKADTNLQDETGKTALIYAIENNSAEQVELLASNNAMKKYKANLDGKEIKFNGCSVARKVRDGLKTKEQKDTNTKIKKSLKCGLRVLIPFI